MSIGFLIKFTGTIMDLLLPWILAYIIDNVIAKENLKEILAWGGLMVVCSIIAMLTNIIANRMASLVARYTTQRIRHDLFTKIMYLSNDYVDKFTIPSLISRMTSDTYNVHRMVGMMQRIGIRAPILLIGGLLVTLTLDPVLTLVLVVVLVFLVFITYTVSSKGIPLFRTVQESTEDMIRVLRENITGVRVIKALSKSDYEKDRFDKVNKKVMNDENKANMVLNTIKPAMNFLLQGGLVGVILLGAFRVNAGVSEVGKIVAFLTYFTIILNAMLSITRIFTVFSRSIASANRIQEVLEVKPSDTTSFENILEKDDEDFITFEYVSFSYNKVKDDVSDISFGIKKGETLGIIGATGSGKSTLLKLLMRFYDPDKGSIRIDGKDVRSYDLKDLRRRFGVVFQNDALFRDTVAENIKLGREISIEDISRSIEHAQASDFVKGVGLDFMLSIKGANFSGGQKQRLLIARALAGRPEILILDDASSALDYKTDASLRRELKKHYKGTTTIIIAQRISSIKHAERIIVLDEGRILGYGTHDELIKSNELYQEIASTQMGEMLV
jgi:ATP-binding cassette subfamily B multidrug efflux pump